MGFIKNMQAKAAERKAEAERIAREEEEKERARLAALSEKELLIEIRMLLAQYDKRLSSIESDISYMQSQVNMISLKE